MEERQGTPRTARCEFHGRVYDSWSDAGCPDCAAQLAAPRPRSRLRPTPILVALAGLAVVWHLHSRLPVLSNTVHVEPAPAPRPAERLDPTPYRAEIEAIEAVLYRDSQIELGDADRVGAAAFELGERLRGDLDRIAGQEALLRLTTFAADVASRAEAGYALPDLATPRRDWQRLRMEWFEPAPWFRREGPGLARAQNPPPLRADLLDVQALEGFADALEPLLAAGRRELMAFGEQYVDVAERSREERELVRAWNDFARDWSERVTRACAESPAAPSLDDDMHVLMAHQRLGQACHQLGIAVHGPGSFAVPMKSWRTSSLDQAAAHLAEARSHLEEATRF